MKDNFVLIGDMRLQPSVEVFIETIEMNGALEKIHITPLHHDNENKAEWFQVIFESGDKRFIQPAPHWGWHFFDQYPEPEAGESEAAEEDLALAAKVGMAIEAYYHIE